MSVKMNLTDMPAVTPADTDLIPVARSGTPNSVNPATMAAHTIDKIEAIAAGTTAPLTDKAYILQGGDLKPVLISVVAQSIIDSVWAKAAETDPDSADKLALLDGTTEKTVTLANLATYVETTIRAAMLNVKNAAVTEAGAFNDEDVLLLTQGTTGKKVTWANVKAGIFAALNGYVSGLTAATTTNDADVLYVIQGGVAKKMTLTKLVEHFTGSSPVTGTGTANAFARWATSSTLKGDITFSTVLQTGTDTNVPSSKAIRDAMNKLVYDQTESEADLEDEDYLMIDDGGAGTAQRKVAMPLVWEYVNAMNAAGEGIKTVVSDSTVTLGAVAGVAILTIPAGSHVLSVQANVAVLAVAGGTSVKIGVGFDADPDAYGLTGSLVQNQKIDTFMKNYDLLLDTSPGFTARGNSVQWTREAIALKAYPCNSSGDIGDTGFTAGSLRVRVVYQVCNSLDDV